MTEYECPSAGVGIPTESVLVVQEDENQPPAVTTPSSSEPSLDASSGAEASPDQIRDDLRHRACEWSYRKWNIMKYLKEAIKVCNSLVPLSNEEVQRAKAFLTALSEEAGLANADVESAFDAALVKDANLEELSCQVSRALQRITDVASQLRRAWDSLGYLANTTPSRRKCGSVLNGIFCWGIGSSSWGGRPDKAIWEEANATNPEGDVASESPCEYACNGDVNLEEQLDVPSEEVA
jgi:hypothetical protein